MQNPGAAPRVLSVTALNQRARQLLETHCAQVWVEGEISNLTRAASGHWYFTLKDAAAQVRCAMFRNRNQLLRFRPENGMTVIVRGRLSLYEARGDYQLIAEHLQESGVGALQRAFEQLKETLRQRGWFDAARKRALPAAPAHIGVITSPVGAALRDILAVLRRRFPAIAVTVFPTPVQGDEAPASIARAIAVANRMAAGMEPPLEVLIVGRGGGSLEDLWAFNEEAVAAAIYHSQLPVVSAVGHETDTSIADFVADLRAPTPSAAAELLSPDQYQLRQRLDQLQRQCAALLGRAAGRRAEQLAALRRRLKHPGARLREYAQRLDAIELRTQRAQLRLLAALTTQLQHTRHHLQLVSPDQRLLALQQRLARQSDALPRHLGRQLQLRQRALTSQAELLQSVSPLQTLRRGYAIVRDDQGRVLRRSSQVQRGDRIHLRLGEGELDATVN